MCLHDHARYVHRLSRQRSLPLLLLQELQCNLVFWISLYQSIENRDALFDPTHTEVDLCDGNVRTFVLRCSIQHTLEKADGVVGLPLRDEHERQIVRGFCVIGAAGQVLPRLGC